MGLYKAHACSRLGQWQRSKPGWSADEAITTYRHLNAPAGTAAGWRQDRLQCMPLTIHSVQQGNWRRGRGGGLQWL